MKYFLSLFLALQLLLLQQAFGQRLLLKLDDEFVASGTVYDYQPYFYQVQLLQGEKQVMITKGTASIVRRGKKVDTQSIAGNRSLVHFSDKSLLPGNRLVIEIEEIQDPESRQTRKTNFAAVVHFKEELLQKPHPHYSLLINNTTDYLNAGLQPATLQTLSFRVTEHYREAKVRIYYVRGVLLMQQTEYASLEEATAGLQQLIKETPLRSGDRFVVELLGKGAAVINIPIRL